MPINPNIALGFQQPQPVNMLGQMGQMMALRGAQQEYEGTNALRDAYAQGGDLNDPEFRRRVMSANPKLGSQLISQHSETSARDVKTQADSLKTIKDNVSLVGSPEAMAEYLRGAYSTPGGMLMAKLVPLDKALASIPTDPKGFADYKRNFGLTADKLFESADAQLTARTRIQAANIGAAAPLGQLELARQKYNYELENPALERVEGENGFYLYNKRDPNSAVPLGMRSVAPPPPPAAANNLFMTTQPNATNLNALTGGAPSQPGAPTVANAAAAAAQPTAIKPKQPFRAPVAVMQDNQAVLVPADKAIGMQPATAFTEKQAYGKTETVRNLKTAIANLTDVIKPGGLLEQSTGSGIGRAYDASAAFFGQATEGAKAAAALAPIADLVLKMVPRFEGPQSDKDTQSYKEAAGQLANSGLPNETRREAAKVIIRLMKERGEQFGMTDQVGGASAPKFTYVGPVEE